MTAAPLRALLLRALVTGLVLALTLVLTGVAAGTARAAEDSIGIRLLPGDGGEPQDPRERVYVVAHAAPGDRVERVVEVSTTSSDPRSVEVYVTPAQIVGGEFVAVDRRGPSDLSGWSSVDRGQVTVAAGAPQRVGVAIDVPADATRGEYYGAVWAAVRGEAGAFDLVNRVGVRIYLSVGPGGLPPVDFSISPPTASRDARGRPVVVSRVVNEGRRAIDVAGRLRLSDGPGGVAAGPVESRRPLSLGPGQSAELEFVLDQGLPAGSWQARVVARSGSVARVVEGEVSFARTAGSGPDLREQGPGGPTVWVMTAMALLLAAGAGLGVRRLRGQRLGPRAPGA